MYAADFFWAKIGECGIIKYYELANNRPGRIFRSDVDPDIKDKNKLFTSS